MSVLLKTSKHFKKKKTLFFRTNPKTYAVFLGVFFVHPGNKIKLSSSKYPG